MPSKIRKVTSGISRSLSKARIDEAHWRIAMTAKQRGNIDFDVVREIARSLPDVEESTSARGMALKIRGKLLACEAIHKSAEPNSLMVRIPLNDRELLLATEPETHYVTAHYRGYPAILVRLSRIDREALRDLLESGVRFVGAKKRRS
jgi:hypothetical protein